MPTAKDVADAMLAHDSPVVTAGDLADSLDCSAEHVRQKMDALLLQDLAGTKQAGARARVYWHVDRVTPPHVAPEDHPDQSDLSDVDDDAGAPQRDDRREEDSAESVTDSDEVDQVTETMDLDAALDALDVPGAGEVAADRREAVRACYEFLRSEGAASRGDFIDAVYGEMPVGYSSGASWWPTMDDALHQLADLRDDVEPPNDGRRGDKWRFVASDE